MERMELMGAGGDEAEAWREYLLYNTAEGFAFLVDAESRLDPSTRPEAAPKPVPEATGRSALRESSNVVR